MLTTSISLVENSARSHSTMTRVHQLVWLLVSCVAGIQGYPAIQRYNPNVYYGPRVLDSYHKENIDYGGEYLPPKHRQRFNNQRNFEGPLDLNDPNIGPEVEQLLKSYLGSADFGDSQTASANKGSTRGYGRESSAELERMLLSYQMLKEFEDRMGDAPLSIGADSNDVDEEPSPELLRVLNAYKELKDFEGRRMTSKRSPVPVRVKPTEKPVISPMSPAPVKVQPAQPTESTEAPIMKEIATEVGQKDGDETSKAVTSIPDNSEAEVSKNDTEPIDELDAATSNRRTFQLLVPAVELGIKMIDADLGLGLTDASAPDTSEHDRARARARAQQSALRESQEKLEMERLKTQAALQQMKSESEIISKNTQMELSSIKTKLDQVSEQTAKERREKEELQIKLEHEAKLRERENQEMKSKLQSEARLREIERTKFQSQLAQEQSKREREKMEMKSKLEMEAAMQEMKMKKSSQETKSAYDTKITTHYVIHDYREPVMSPMQYPPTVTKTTVGFV